MTKYEYDKREKLKETKPKVYEKVCRYEERYNRGESIAVIQLQYNYMCNMYCSHCSISEFRKDKTRRTLTPIDVKSIADQADEYGLGQLDLTGGEPLIFPDLEEVIRAIDTSRFYCMVDTNGWLMTQEKADWLKSLGVDRIQISLDNFYPEEHDEFRHKPGSHARAIKALEYVNKAGLKSQLSTVIFPGRVKSEEFRQFLNLAKTTNSSINAIVGKSVGMWAGRDDLTLPLDERKMLYDMAEEYEIGVHIRKIYGLNLGCIACKKIISITAYGDVLPCIWMYLSLGNIFDTPLKDILAKGMSLFSKYHPVCRMSEDRGFLKRYNELTKDRDLPIPIEEMFT